MVTVRGITGETSRVEEKDLVLSVCLYAVVVKDSYILVSPQWKENGYDFPGGHLNLGEQHLDCLIREVREETGFIIKPLKVLDVFTSYFMHPSRKAEHNIMIYYAAEIASGEISTDGFDESEKSYARPARFVTFDELKKMELMSDKKILETIIPYLESLNYK